MRRPTRRHWTATAALAAGLTTPGCGPPPPAPPPPAPPAAATRPGPDGPLREFGERAAKDAAGRAAEALEDRARRKLPAGAPRPKAGWGKVGRFGVGIASGLAERWIEEHKTGRPADLDDELLRARAAAAAPVAPAGPGARAAAPPSPFVGVWDVALTPAGRAESLAPKRASFHGDGRWTLGPESGPPDLAVAYRVDAGTLLVRADPGAEEEALPATWAAGGDAFTLAVPRGTLAFRRRPVAAAFAGATAAVPAGGAAVEVRARLRVDNAPGLPVEARCRLFDDAGRPVPARPGAGLAGFVAAAAACPPADAAGYAEVRLTVPLADLPVGLAGREVRFTLEAWCPRDRREVADAPAWGTFVVPPAAPAPRPAAAPKP